MEFARLALDLERQRDPRHRHADEDSVEGKIEDGYIRKVKGNSYMEDLTSGNAVAGILRSTAGEVTVLGGGAAHAAP